MNCTCIENILIGIISGIISGSLINCYLNKKENKKLNLIREQSLNDIINDIIIYIQLFLNEPINFNNKKTKPSTELLNIKINILKQRLRSIENLKIIEHERDESKLILLQLKIHFDRIYGNKLYYADKTLLSDEQIEKAGNVVKNIDLYLNPENNDFSYLGITMELTAFLDSIKDLKY